MTMHPVYDDEGNQIGESPGVIVSCIDPDCENHAIGIDVPDLGVPVICGPCGALLAAAD